MRICFDMDGTLANLYAIENWLTYLENEDATPYMKAQVMLNMSALARQLNKLQKVGHKIIIISWASKNCSDKYKNEIQKAKIEWLKKHLPSVTWDEINIVHYGINKSKFANNSDDILFDDEKKNRDAWIGKAYDEKNILKILRQIA